MSPRIHPNELFLMDADLVEMGILAEQLSPKHVEALTEQLFRLELRDIH